MVRSKFFMAMALTGMVITSTADGEIVIDDFTGPDGGQFAEDIQPNDVPTWKAKDELAVLGGTREIYSNTIEGDGLDQGIRGEANGDGRLQGIFSYDQYSSVYAGVGKLIYDGVANGALDKQGFVDAGFDGGINLSGSDGSFLFEDVVVTGSGLDLTVNLYNALTGDVFSSSVVSLTDNFRGNFFISYDDFGGPGGVDTLTHVGAIEVLIDGSKVTGSDMTIGRLTSTAVTTPPAVPEPSSLILAGLASIGGLGFRMRRGKKKVAAAAV